MNVIGIALITVELLARIIAGEASSACGVQGKLAVAHVWANRQAAGIQAGWNGDREPSQVDLLVARNFQYLDDPTHGALYLFSDGDLTLPAVQSIVSRREFTLRVACGANGLNAYR